MGIHLESQYVGKYVIIRSGADLMSRVEDTSDCRLKPSLFHRIWRKLGPVSFDRFASFVTAQRHPSSNKRLPYNSLFADEGSAGVNALYQSWAGQANYAFRPVHVISKVVDLVRAAKCKCVLVAPVWPSQPWWPDVLALSTRELT